MVGYSFKDRFVARIEQGTKRQTIRAVGKKRHARPGELIQIYTGPRFRPRRIGQAICESTLPITLNFEKATPAGRPLAAHAVIGRPGDARVIRRDQRYSDGESLDDFARSDGFDDWAALEAFWRETHGAYRKEWWGLMITWRDFTPPIPAGDTP